MAKVRTPGELFVYRTHEGGQRYIPAEGGRALLRRKTTWKKLHSEVSVIRTGGGGNKAFEACVVIGQMKSGYSWEKAHAPGHKRASGYTTSCMFGRNPREALKHALQRAVRQIGKRRGAFARY